MQPILQLWNYITGRYWAYIIKQRKEGYDLNELYQQTIWRSSKVELLNRELQVQSTEIGREFCTLKNVLKYCAKYWTEEYQIWVSLVKSISIYCIALILPYLFLTLVELPSITTRQSRILRNSLYMEVNSDSLYKHAHVV